MEDQQIKKSMSVLDQQADACASYHDALLSLSSKLQLERECMESYEKLSSAISSISKSWEDCISNSILPYQKTIQAITESPLKAFYESYSRSIQAITQSLGNNLRDAIVPALQITYSESIRKSIEELRESIEALDISSIADEPSDEAEADGIELPGDFYEKAGPVLSLIEQQDVGHGEDAEPLSQSPTVRELSHRPKRISASTLIALIALLLQIYSVISDHCAAKAAAIQQAEQSATNTAHLELESQEIQVLQSIDNSLKCLIDLVEDLEEDEDSPNDSDEDDSEQDSLYQLEDGDD